MFVKKLKFTLKSLYNFTKQFYNILLIYIIGTDMLQLNYELKNFICFSCKKNQKKINALC